MKLNQLNRAGFTLVEIMIVVAIIGLLMAIAVPNFIKARTESQKRACVENLRKIDGAKHNWAIENKKVSSETPTTAQLYGETLYIREEPKCPASGTYTINRVNLPPNCTVAGHSI